MECTDRILEVLIARSLLLGRLSLTGSLGSVSRKVLSQAPKLGTCHRWCSRFAPSGSCLEAIDSVSVPSFNGSSHRASHESRTLHNEIVGNVDYEIETSTDRYNHVEDNFGREN